MASASSSSVCSPSSSAVTIQIPGKSILKRPPPPQHSLFSRITRFLPTQNQNSSANEDETKPLKRAHFILPQIAIVYPISSLNPPSTPSLKDEKKAIEDREIERRRRIVRGNSMSSGVTGPEEWWSMDKVESFYRECCAGGDEVPDPAITAALKHASPSSPRAVDLSGVQLTWSSASNLAHVFTIEWGLRKLVFRECDLDELSLKPILHALLIPGTLSFLSVASNRRLKPPAFRLLGAYMKKATSLEFLDISQNALDKKSIDYIVAALPTAPEPGLVSLRLDDCYLRPAALEALCRAVRTSSLRNISLRHNRIAASGGVAIALMIRDYPDIVPGLITPSSSGTPNSSTTSSPTSSVSGVPYISQQVTPPTTTSMQNAVAGLPATRNIPNQPPPRHPAVNMQTTYTPYVPRARRGPAPPTTATNPLSPSGQHVPLITSSSRGGVTMRHTQPGTPAGIHDSTIRHDSGPSAALLDKVRALDSLPRLGALRTLDLKGNDLRTGITYIAQVLKRNRTLKVLNLSENKLDVACLVSIAEALKYNSSLETLDLSKNPCSGPGLEGIQSLRTAFTLNTALKRLFLSSTSLSSSGAIALAEFLPESTSLLHLDLTMNDLDIAGVMALSSGLKANHTMRCLDLNIPPGDEEFARMCREILNSCVRNTEEAERNAKHIGEGNKGTSGRGLGKGVWNMIEESKLARHIRLGEEKKNENDPLVRARAYIQAAAESTSDNRQGSPKPPFSELSEKIRATVDELTVVIQTTEDPERLEELLQVNDQLLALLQRTPESKKPNLTLQHLGQPNANDPSDINAVTTNGHIHNMAESGQREEQQDDVFNEESPTTPKVDKGKGRAEPEPEELEKILSPTFLLSESSDDDDDEGEVHFHDAVEHEGEITSPTDRYADVTGVASVTNPETARSRSWVAEEGEVFRKGTVLLGPEEMEGEYAGEELRKELLEAMVERPPPRPLTDEFGMEVIPGAGDFAHEREHPASVSPTSPTFPDSQTRPYISRSRSSSSSILGMISPISSPQISTPENKSSQSPVIATSSPISPTSPDISATSRVYLSKNRSVPPG